jgi:hypothetical protein
MLHTKLVSISSTILHHITNLRMMVKTITQQTVTTIVIFAGINSGASFFLKVSGPIMFPKQKDISRTAFMVTLLVCPA